MIVTLDARLPPTLTDADNLTALKVLAPPGGDRAAMLNGLGRPEGDHAWLGIAALRGMGPDDAGWRAGFDAMIVYAASKGWLSADGLAVRSHVETVET